MARHSMPPLASETEPARRTVPARGCRLVRRETVVPTGLEATFAFFADAANLDAITPSWLRFRILTPMPIAMGEGAEIRYSIRVHGVPMGWRTEITAWEPPHRFVDLQREGPYRRWRHEHRFEACGEGTRVIDEVEYRAPMGWLLHPLFVTRDVERIFDFRQQALRAHLTAPLQEGLRTGSAS